MLRSDCGKHRGGLYNEMRYVFCFTTKSTNHHQPRHCGKHGYSLLKDFETLQDVRPISKANYE
jgi:hypothetical protein